LEQWGQLPDSTTPSAGGVYTGSRQQPAAADFSCLGKPDPSPTSTLESITATGVLEDFQTEEPVAAAEIAVWSDVARIGSAPAAKTTTAADGTFTLVVPGTKGLRMLHWRSSKEGEAFPTYELAERFKVDAAQQKRDRASVSLVTGDLMPAVAGIQREPGTGIVAGRIEDCAGDEVGNAIATVLGADDLPLVGIQTVYFNDDELPARRDPEKKPESVATNAKSGLFVVANIPPSAAPVTIAVEGRIGGTRTRLSEFRTPVLADTLIFVTDEPKRAQ